MNLYILIFVIYYFIGIYVLIEVWRKSLDVTLGYLLMSVLFFWIIWPLIYISEIFNDIIIFKRRQK